MLKAGTVLRRGLGLVLVGLAVGWGGCAKRPPAGFCTVYDERQACAILLPERASEEEQRAAKFLQATLAKAAGRPHGDFVIVRTPPASGPVIFLRGRSQTDGAELDEYVTCVVTPDLVELSAYPADAIEGAAAWFLEQKLGAQWFMPGPLGEHIPRTPVLRLPVGVTRFDPAYISRDLYVGDGAPGATWWRRNRLRSRFEHGHAMNRLFTPDDLRANPELAPLINGARLVPASADAANWQPNLSAPGAVDHVVARLRERSGVTASISLNDGLRFDQSEATRGQLGQPPWFRQRPDFSPWYFKFANAVAARLPGRRLGAYAYYWTEQAPPFTLERNLVPYLTADRSTWSDPDFAAEDQALIRRWVAAGTDVVGLYDYYYGAPFLVPRPTLWAVTDVIPFARRAGVRAFFAEAAPNWSLDGPKLWLAAQLLWDSTRPPDDLLETYYREFWREARGPMREFYRLADEQWRRPPPPVYWLKFYKDEEHHQLFPAEVRRQLRERLDEAMALANTELTRNRLRFVAAGFSVTEAYAAWAETREELSRLAFGRAPDKARLHDLVDAYTVQKEALLTRVRDVRREHPLALGGDLAKEFLYNDPVRRAEWRLHGDAGRLGDEQLQDTGLLFSTLGPVAGAFDVDWMRSVFWSGHGEPYQTRSITLGKQGSPVPTEAFQPKSVRLTGCKQEFLGQAVTVIPGREYLARVRIRGQASPGNMTYLLVTFRDAKGRACGETRIDRLPQGHSAEAGELLIRVEAPAMAAEAVYAVCVLNQVNDDQAEFWDFSFREIIGGQGA